MKKFYICYEWAEMLVSTMGIIPASGRPSSLNTCFVNCFTEIDWFKKDVNLVTSAPPGKAADKTDILVAMTNWSLCEK